MKRLLNFVLEHNAAFVAALILETILAMLAGCVIALFMMKIMIWLMKVIL